MFINIGKYYAVHMNYVKQLRWDVKALEVQVLGTGGDFTCIKFDTEENFEQERCKVIMQLDEHRNNTMGVPLYVGIQQ